MYTFMLLRQKINTTDMHFFGHYMHRPGALSRRLKVGMLHACLAIALAVCTPSAGSSAASMQAPHRTPPASSTIAIVPARSLNA